MKAFVAGATGLTGRHVVETLVEQGVEAIAHVRPDSGRLADWTTRFEAAGAIVDTAPWTAEGMTAAMARHRPDRVFALLGTTKKRAKAGDGDYRAVDYGLTVMLIDAVVAAGLTDCRVIYLSALGADGGRGAYMAVRKDVEAHLRETGLPFTIARPSFIIGDRDAHRPGEAWGSTVVDGAMAALGLVARKAADRIRSITGRELAEGLVRVALDPAGAGQIVTSAELR